MGNRQPALSHAPRSTWMLIPLLIVWTSGPALGQTPLAEVIPTLLGPGMTIAPGPGGTHAQEFVRLPGQVELVPGPFGLAGVDTPRGFDFNNKIIEQLPTFPIGSSSGGFLYAFDPAVGTFVRSTRSFGASYGERPLTSGRGTLSVGFSVQRVTFDRFDGTDLESGDIRFYYLHRDRNAAFPPPLTPERSDVMEATLRLRLSTQTVLTTITYGFTDRLDIGATVPQVKATLMADVDKRILRLGTAADPTIHSFDGLGSSTERISDGGTASGIGDLRFLAKYNVLRRRGGAVAGGADLRLPTGDARNLLGSGTVFARLFGMVSTGTRTFAPHGNVGVTLASKNFNTSDLIGEPDDEINYTVGFDWSVVPRVTVSGDMLGRRRLSGSFKNALADRTLQFVSSTGGPVQSTTVREFQLVDYADRHLLQSVVGTKIGPWRTMLFVANLLLPVTDAGLRNRPSLSIGAEYTF